MAQRLKAKPKDACAKMAIARTSMGSQLTGNRRKSSNVKKGTQVPSKTRKTAAKKSRPASKKMKGLTIGPHERSTVGKV
jgi:hypothetical protein